jgi:hypothetical protein
LRSAGSARHFVNTGQRYASISPTAATRSVRFAMIAR